MPAEPKPQTLRLSRLALPAHAHQRWGHGLLGALMEPGAYAVDPEPFRHPWRRWDDVGAAEAEARGVYPPVFSLPWGPRGPVALAPGDVHGTVFIPERSAGGCCGLDGHDGPNLACARCGRPVATRIDDCGRWQAVWLDPTAVDRRDSPGQTLGWASLSAFPGVPAVEPPGHWSPRWEAAVAVALARLLAVSGGVRVTVPDGAAAFRRAIDALLPPGPAASALALDGPGLPAGTADIALVPEHPQTGEPWTPPGAAAVVPLAWEVWVSMALGHAWSSPGRRAGARGGSRPRSANGAIDAYRSRLGWPYADSPAFREDLAAAVVRWAFLSTAWFLPRALPDRPPPAKVTPHPRARILHRLQQARESTELPALASLADRLHAALTARWGPTPLRYAPAFASRPSR